MAFLGPGPWQSIAPALPSVPSQLLEGVWVAIGVLVLAFFARRARFGTVFLWALVWWLSGRIAIAFTWRDQALIGPLAVEQTLAIGVLLVVVSAAGPRSPALAAVDASADVGPAWPERPIDPTELPAPVIDRSG